MDPSLAAFVVVGILCGAFTGLVPGIHVNTVAPLASTLIPILGSGPLGASCFLCAMSVTHTFIDFIPATLLGVPDDDTALSILPAHRMVLKGEGLEAIWISGVASLFAVFSIAATIPLFLWGLEATYNVLKNSTPFVLIGFLIMIVFSQKNKTIIFYSIIIALLAGSLGMLTLNSQYLVMDPLFPVFSGFFGISSLLLSIEFNPLLPQQKEIHSIHISKNIITSIIFGTVSGIIVSTMPGIGAGQATILSSKLNDTGGDGRCFIASCCATNTANAVFALLMLYLFNKARNGALVHVQQFMGDITHHELMLLIGVMCMASGASFVLLVGISSTIAGIIENMKYSTISIIGISVQIGAILALTGPYGVLLAGISTCIGLLPQTLGVSRSTLMSYLLIPVLMYYI